MKTILRFFSLSAMLAMFCLAPSAARAADPASAPSPFGVIDTARIMQTTDAAKDIFAQMDAKQKEYQADLSKEGDALRGAEQDLIKQKDKLSKDDFDKKRKELEERALKGQKLVQDRKRTLDQGFNRAMAKLRGETTKIVADIAKDKNYAAVLTQDAVILSMPTLDITDAVIEKLNKTVKKIPVDWSAAPAPADGKKG